MRLEIIEDESRYKTELKKKKINKRISKLVG